MFGFPESTSHFGGYDTRSIIEINSGNFKVKSTMHVTTGEIFEFCKKLLTANEELKGDVHFNNYERDLDFNLKYDVNGHISVIGKYSDHSEFDNRLDFDFESDQTYIQSTLRQLHAIAEKYGDMKGIK
ncbi:MAG TPA: hypothetical protein VK671_14445 [Mucilaginibacter sp.]|nr:hypothetical protein [Mucilaginibacter sp.]